MQLCKSFSCLVFFRTQHGKTPNQRRKVPQLLNLPKAKEDNRDVGKVYPFRHPGCLRLARSAQILECAIQLLKQRLEQIAFCDNANDSIIVVDDRQAADLIFDHQQRRLA
jgi:hypothetical protein